MTIFLRALNENSKDCQILNEVDCFRSGEKSPDLFIIDPESFRSLPGTTFSYWAGAKLLKANSAHKNFEPDFGVVRVGVQTDDDPRFVRLWWEVLETRHDTCCSSSTKGWVPFVKGDNSSRFYFNLVTTINWSNSGEVLKAATVNAPGGRVNNETDFFKPGLSWALRTLDFSPHFIPSGCIPSVSRYLAIPEKISLGALLAFWNSSLVDALSKLRMEKIVQPKFIVGAIKTLPMPALSESIEKSLSSLAEQGWRDARNLNTVNETSHAFLLPQALRSRLNHYDTLQIEESLADLKRKIDEIVFHLFDFNALDRATVLSISNLSKADTLAGTAAEDLDECGVAEVAQPLDRTDSLLSWAVGVAFGRFDWNLATGKRDAPAEPHPLDPLPAKSPGMLPEASKPFHAHDGILVDDQGNSYDLPRLIEEVLSLVDAEVPGDIRRWLHRDFFNIHLKQYSKSRRKAPIYWPLSTTSGSYTLWLYYPSLNSQTLFTAVNDFIEGPNGKLSQVRRERAVLQEKSSARSSDEEKRYEALQVLELELIELRDTLLQIAPTYNPNHDDGVQISAAPLWQLFRQKRWQKILQDTWAKLDKGEYDWAHLAMAYWPDRIRKKCETDKSLAIVHDLEHIYIEPEPKAAKAHGRKKDAQ